MIRKHFLVHPEQSVCVYVPHCTVLPLQYGFVGRWLNPGKGTVGALDLGGASTQITFATQDTVEDKRNNMKLRLYGQDYSLYTHSFLCYGQDQVLLKVLALLFKVREPLSQRRLTLSDAMSGHHLCL